MNLNTRELTDQIIGYANFGINVFADESGAECSEGNGKILINKPIFFATLDENGDICHDADTHCVDLEVTINIKDKTIIIVHPYIENIEYMTKRIENMVFGAANTANLEEPSGLIIP